MTLLIDKQLLVYLFSAPRLLNNYSNSWARCWQNNAASAAIRDHGAILSSYLNAFYSDVLFTYEIRVFFFFNFRHHVIIFTCEQRDVTVAHICLRHELD